MSHVDYDYSSYDLEPIPPIDQAVDRSQVMIIYLQYRHNSSLVKKEIANNKMFGRLLKTLLPSDNKSQEKSKKKSQPKKKPQKKPQTQSERKPIPSALRNSVWIQYHGRSNIGRCYCCGTSVTRYNRGWHCAHVKSDAKGGPTTLDNLRVSCPHCNLSMGDQNLYAYIRDKQLSGPGRRNINTYFRAHPDQKHDVRTNNWGKSNKSNKSNKSQPRKKTTTQPQKKPRSRKKTTTQTQKKPHAKSNTSRKTPNVEKVRQDLKVRPIVTVA